MNTNHVPEKLKADLLRDIVHTTGPEILERMRQNMSLPNDVLVVEELIRQMSDRRQI